MSVEEWEAICRCCGRCCYEKIEFEGQIYYTDVPCDKLDMENLRCTVYADRTRLRSGCVKLTPELAAQGFLPADCAYVVGIPGYCPPVLFEDSAE